MSGPSAVSKLGEKTRVVARVMNGTVFSILATSRGMVSCLEKYEDDPKRHSRTPSLQEFVVMVRAIEILLPNNPNVDRPVLTRRIKTKKFQDSGEDFQNTGGGTVRHLPAKSARLTTMA
ncbi:MAG: hypothetical protein HYT38_01405 [Candidatus Sungbacteria bacterium]|uniref:Uncharacterized protein n=1 Tax=Candidatus Sungiibacteriota bacterium TaxID=2750080 RepID=A0A931YD69_9BACT|nr:hypothetical protein [Candidatus Sungbacteria bacterium]MBI2465758.1 hypothetical protein [Candidatus Sungbacteria bacterium]